MAKKEDSLLSINTKLFKAINRSSSFSTLYNSLYKDRYKLVFNFEYEEVTLRVKELKSVINKITSIIFKPHIKVTTNEIITRSELSGPLSNESFYETMRDSRLWKNKNGKMTPEHVHSLENIDTLDTYENRFISYLVTLIEQEIKDLLINVTPLVDSIEEIFEQSGISYGKTSILNSLNKVEEKTTKAIYSSWDEFTSKKEINAARKIYKAIKDLEKRIKLIKNTEFYKFTHKYIDKNILPTNILIHDDLYSYCYRFYKSNYLIKTKDDNYKDIYYYNYVLLNLFYYLSKLEVGQTTQTLNAKVSVDSSKRLRFEEVSFKRGLFSFFVKEDPDDLGFYIETHLINNAIKVNTKVDEAHMARYYFYTSYDYKEDNEARILLSSSKEDCNNSIILTSSNMLGDYNSVLTLSLYKKNHETILSNLIKSLTLIFSLNTEVFEVRCPVCGSKKVYTDAYTYRCENCDSSYSLINIEEKPHLFIKSLRRKY